MTNMLIIADADAPLPSEIPEFGNHLDFKAWITHDIPRLIESGVTRCLYVTPDYHARVELDRENRHGEIELKVL
jgi:hypothetical protein